MHQRFGQNHLFIYDQITRLSTIRFADQIPIVVTIWAIVPRRVIAFPAARNNLFRSLG